MRAPGRSCPASYGYGPETFTAEPSLEVDSLWIAGGLYGNSLSLHTLLDLVERERGSKALVFNGDFHWFDIDAPEFQRINEAVLGCHATRGNVETELADPSPDAGCGCGYPAWVGEETVQRSNRILERLRATARSVPQTLRPLAALPMQLLARVGDARVAIVHGDADSLAGWGFSQETLGTADGAAAADAALRASAVNVFASSHTCLPVLRRFADDRAIVNNGAAGMPNFRGERFGVATRISLSPSRDALYGVRRGALFIDAIALRYDHAAWERRFLAQWPPGSDAHASYYERIVRGPDYTRASANPNSG